MKTFTRYEDLPANAYWLGNMNGDGSVYEELCDAIEEAAEPVRLLLPDGETYGYFDIGLRFRDAYMDAEDRANRQISYCR